MATTRTMNVKLAQPAVADRDWHVPLNDNAERLDAMAPLGGLCVTPTEIPGAGRAVRVAPGKFRRKDGTVGSFAGAPSVALAAEQTSSLYLTDGGALAVSTAGYPATAHVRLATAVTDASTVTGLVDDRVACSVTGTDALPYLPLAGGTLADGANLALGTAAGTRLGTSDAQRLGFWGATPIVRPGPFTQAYAATNRTLNAYTPAARTGAYPAINNAQPGTVYAQAADLNDLRAAYENLRALTENVAQVLGALLNDLRSAGLIR